MLTTYFLNTWKIVQIVMIFKLEKKKTEDISSYRPIDLLTMFSSVTEKIHGNGHITNELMSFVEGSTLDKDTINHSLFSSTVVFPHLSNLLSYFHNLLKWIMKFLIRKEFTI